MSVLTKMRKLHGLLAPSGAPKATLNEVKRSVPPAVQAERDAQRTGELQQQMDAALLAAVEGIKGDAASANSTAAEFSNSAAADSATEPTSGRGGSQGGRQLDQDAAAAAAAPLRQPSARPDSKAATMAPLVTSEAADAISGGHCEIQPATPVGADQTPFQFNSSSPRDSHACGNPARHQPWSQSDSGGVGHRGMWQRVRLNSADLRGLFLDQGLAPLCILLVAVAAMWALGLDTPAAVGPPQR